MSEQSIPLEMEKLAAVWGAALAPLICPHCDWRYLAPATDAPAMCSHCCRGTLTPFTPQPTDPLFHPPELALPFTLRPEALAQRIETFAGEIPFAPSDLRAETLHERLQRVYLPLWLVDADVAALWQGEVGYDYEVASHRDRYDENARGWQSQRITETRVRWEPRVGQLTRAYHNVPAPALEEEEALPRDLGLHDLQPAQPYDAAAVTRALVRLPNRSPDDAWPDALPALQQTAARECQQAAAAQHIRDFRWSPTFSGQHWTLLLQPVFTTYYLDDEGQPQPLLIHGQTGQLSGPRRASLKRAQRTALFIAAVAVLLFVLSVMGMVIGLVLPPVLLLGAIGLLIALALGVGAVVPLAIVWRFNRKRDA